jgi:hypothetical protein
VSRGDDTYIERRYHPFSRTPFLVGALLFVFTLLGWVGIALYAIGRFDTFASPCLLIGTGLLLVGAALPLAFARARTRRALKGWLAKNEDGLALLRAGRYADAAEIWSELVGHAKWAPAVHALLVHNLAVAILHMGRPRRAIALMEEVERSKWFTARSLTGANTNLHIAHALAHAIVGNLERAEELRNTAAEALTEGRRGATMLVDTVIGARRGTLKEPPTTESLRLAEAALMPTHVRAIPILHAFAKTKGDGGYRTAEEDGPRAEGGGLAPGDLDFLAAEWPELAAFLHAATPISGHT